VKNSFVVGEEDRGVRLDVFLCRKMESLSRSQVQRLIDDKLAGVSGAAVKASYRLSPGEEVDVEVPSPRELEVGAENIPLDIVYEDACLLVINKPRGMVVHPANGNYTGTLVNALMYHCRDLSGINGVLRPGIVHRIDKDTSGLLLVAKNDFAHRELARQIKEHSLSRIYLALVHGNITEPGGIIEAPIGRSLADRQKMAVGTRNSKDAVTEYRVLERLGAYTLVECRLKTGRTHQIRVHMAYLKHPVVGDPKYGPSKAQVEFTGQALHAQMIGFTHPESGERMEFSVPPPQVFIELLRTVGSKGGNFDGEYA
jgi:23S rRNA pseudouridine1911/1915/1917 synthase